MGALASRLTKLEAATNPLHSGVLRIICYGEMTSDQARQVEDAKAAGKLVIVRQIVSPAIH